MDAGVAGARDLDAEAAVGLDKRSADALLSVAFFVGVGNVGAAARDRARDAAVGANRPELEEGVFGLVTGVLEREAVAGVLGRLGEVAVDDGRCVLAGVLLLADRVDVPVCCGLSGTCAEGGERGDRTGVLVLDAAEAAAREAAAGDLAGVTVADFFVVVVLLGAGAGLGGSGGSAVMGVGGITFNSADEGSGSAMGSGSGAGSSAGSAVSSTGGVMIEGGETEPVFAFS